MLLLQLDIHLVEGRDKLVSHQPREDEHSHVRVYVFVGLESHGPLLVL